MYCIKEGIKHQNIGGKEFIVDEQVTEQLTNDMVFQESENSNWACKNFIERRNDFNLNFPFKLYYGKVNGLGYVMAEDELIEVIE